MAWQCRVNAAKILAFWECGWHYQNGWINNRRGNDLLQRSAPRFSRPELDDFLTRTLNVIIKTAGTSKTKEEVAALFERVLRAHHFQARVLSSYL